MHYEPVLFPYVVVPFMGIVDNMLYLCAGCLAMEASKSFGRKQEERYPMPPSITCEESGSSPVSSKKREEFFVKRSKVKQALGIFRNLFSKLLSEYEADQLGHLKAKSKALMEAAMLMQRKHQWVNSQKRVGHVPGIEVGDLFQYRTELNVVGLHRQFSSGVDYMSKGKNSLATSIVVTNRYANARNLSGSLVYIGHGGNPNVRSNSVPHDQKLEGGNLALKNSMDAKSPVRVILKIFRKSGGTGSNSISEFSFIYDGLYLVEKMTQERGEFGKLVFKFQLNRILGQPSTCVAPKDAVMENDINSGQFASFTLRKRHKSKGCVAKKDVVIVNDISKGQEKFPIRMVTSTNGDQLPQSFDYIVNNIYADSFKKPMIFGCDCVDGCVDCEKCACIVKNGGRMPYDSKKRLASELKSSLIYECGPSCKCSSSCINRVSQYGLQFQLEIFKTELKGWGVRTRSFIPSGSFVCEYIGEVRHHTEVGSRQNVDSCIVNMGMFMVDTISSLYLDCT